MLSFFLILESLNETWVSFDIFTLRFDNKKNYFESYCTAQNSVQQAVSVAALMYVRALHGMTLFRPSNNSDRRFRFFKTTSHAIALPCLFCYQPAKNRMWTAVT